MKNVLIVGTIAVVAILLGVPLSSAVIVRPSPPTSTQTSVDSLIEETVRRVVPAPAAEQLVSLLRDHPEVVQAMAVDGSHPHPVVLEKLAGSNSSLLTKLWTIVLYYRLSRFLFSYGVYAVLPSKIMALRVLGWGIKILKWIEVGLILGVIDIPQTPPTTPDITFEANETNRTLTVMSVNYTGNVLWSDIAQIGNGTCDSLPTGVVEAGQMITNCSGVIMLQYVPSGVLLYTHEFP